MDTQLEKAFDAAVEAAINAFLSWMQIRGIHYNGTEWVDYQQTFISMDYTGLKSAYNKDSEELYTLVLS